MDKEFDHNKLTNMNEISAKMDRLTDRLNLVVRNYDKLQSDYLEMARERDTLQEQLTHQNHIIKDLEDKVKIVQMSKKAIISIKDNASLKHSLDEIITEIDRCIDKLNN